MLKFINASFKNIWQIHIKVFTSRVLSNHYDFDVKIKQNNGGVSIVNYKNQNVNML